MTDPYILVEIMSLVKNKMPFGVAVTELDIEKAKDIVWVRHSLDTIKWKMENIDINWRP